MAAHPSLHNPLVILIWLAVILFPILYLTFEWPPPYPWDSLDVTSGILEEEPKILYFRLFASFCSYSQQNCGGVIAFCSSVHPTRSEGLAARVFRCKWFYWWTFRAPPNAPGRNGCSLIHSFVLHSRQLVPWSISPDSATSRWWHIDLKVDFYKNILPAPPKLKWLALRFSFSPTLNCAASAPFSRGFWYFIFMVEVNWLYESYYAIHTLIGATKREMTVSQTLTLKIHVLILV